MSSNRNGHDRIIDSVVLYDENDPTREGLCREDIPTEQAAGSVGLFHAELDEELMQNPRKTVIMAMPLDVSYEQGLSATALILEGELPDNEVSLDSIQFPQHIHTQILPQERTISMSESGGSMTVVTIYPDKGTSNQPHWKVYGNGELGNYVLPQCIESFGDPLASIEASRFIRTSNIHLQSGKTLKQSLFEANGVQGLYERVAGFTTHHETW